MCGIAGVFGRRDDPLVGAMLGRLVHRGPDDQHVHGGDDYGLGAARLSIIDLEGGRQPLTNETGRVVGCQNGEIYDFIELRQELEARGHRFASRTDTEILVHGYEEWGQGLAERLVGMFAVAVWDEEERAGLLIRDRVGKKPLYYHVAPDGAVFFASEIKSLLLVPSVSREIDPVALDLYLSLKHVPAPFTIWRDIRELPAGHLLRYGAGKVQAVERYHRLDWSPGPLLGPEEASEAILEALERAIRRRLRSDVPVGFFLSGGVDSSLVSAMAASISDRPIHTFTLGYGAKSSTQAKDLDVRCAKMVAERYGTIHVEEQIATGDLSQDLPTVLAHFDQPFSGVISTFYLARRIAQDVKVALSGDGADELFGSYLSHRLAAALSRPGADLAERYNVYPDLFARSQGKPEWAWRADIGVFTPADKAELYTDAYRQRLSNADGPSVEAYFQGIYADATGAEPLNRVLEVEFQSQLPDQVLAFVDRLSMAHSLEVRSPFLDQDLTELVARIAPEDKISPAGNVKAALKRAARRYLPDEVIDRPKEGFLMPINSWLQGSLGPWVRECLSPAALERTGVFAPEPVQRLVDEFLGGRTGAGARVFSLLSFQVWHQLYFEGEGAAAALPGTHGPRSIA